MQFDLEPGDYVINPTKKEWGNRSNSINYLKTKLPSTLKIMENK